jgi:glycosyltransferase involved in cell wall biosynthesis
MRILVLAYAFPPLHVQMTSVLLKAMAGLKNIGVSADIVTVKEFPSNLPYNTDLVSYAESIFVRRIYVGGVRKVSTLSLMMSERFAMSDVMSDCGHQMLSTVLDLDLSRYAAIMTWSPFHSINNVMLQLKSRRPDVKWIAQFSDPWANNPLEQQWLKRIWNKHFEARMIVAADAIVHCSAASMELMAHNARDVDRAKLTTISHCYDPALYNDKPPGRSGKMIVRHVGTLFGRRSPEPLFQAIGDLLIRRPELADRLSVDLVGKIETGMLSSAAAKRLPTNLVQVVREVGFLDSLRLMKSADLLVLIEADVKHNLFVPSKLFDYAGSGTPIFGIVPSGASCDLLNSLGGWHAAPDDVEGLSRALEQALDHVQKTPAAPWCNEEFRRSLSAEAVALEYKAVIERVVG